MKGIVCVTLLGRAVAKSGWSALLLHFERLLLSGWEPVEDYHKKGVLLLLAQKVAAYGLKIDTAACKNKTI